MSAAFEKAKEQLAAAGKLTPEDVEKLVTQHGDMTDEERMWLASEQLKLERAGAVTITMDEYLAASKVLDTAPEGSDEYNKALKLVEAYESGG